MHGATEAPHDDVPTLVAWGTFEGNPWQRIVAEGVRAAGMRSTSIDHGASLAPWIERAARQPVVVHDNWIAPIAHRASDGEAARAEVLRHLADVDALQRAGGRLLWTMHNAASHEMVHADAERALVEGLAERADAVHVMHDGARALVPAAGRDRVVVVQHPSYAGVYPQSLGRAAARAELQVPDGVIAVLAFGILRPYKDVPAVVRGFLAARAAGVPLHLLVAGGPGVGYQPGWLAALAGRDDATIQVGHVPDDRVHVWHRAADAVAMPQRTGLSSGALLLAATFGLPVVAGPSHAARAREGEGWVVVEDVDDDDWLRRGIAALDEHAFAAALAAARRASPQTVGREMAAVVRSLAAASMA